MTTQELNTILVMSRGRYFELATKFRKGDCDFESDVERELLAWLDGYLAAGGKLVELL